MRTPAWYIEADRQHGSTGGSPRPPRGSVSSWPGQPPPPRTDPRVQSKACRSLAASLGFLVGTLYASAQSYSVDWFKIAAGGGTSTGSVYSVSGTIGQHDAGGPMTNGPYSLVGGFWVLPILVQTPGAPTLHLTNASHGFATIWWTPSLPDFVLQLTDSLWPTNWTDAPSGTNSPVTVPTTLPARFYRLFKP